MNKNKVITLGLAIALSIGAVACTKKTETPKTEPKQEQSTTTNDNTYSEYYTKHYNEYLSGLNNYMGYETVESRNKMFEGKEYPGNETYLTDVKKAYTDSKDKIQSFVDALKKNTDITDEKDKKDNEALIAEGEKLIAELDTRIKKLGEVPKDAYTKTKDEFMNMVNDATTATKDFKNDFNVRLKEMNTRFDINTKDKK
ncbi:hypothetical protein CHL78_008760 [Romboutsia weinsteinii]|uniref:Lipoprotein n=1 Tax=Romboutsia weinsteinii TaxID=2020949 RepID=A0A371J4F3_9FIRM|nr:hypothetical protein [Romboutsia weinsteinii]RDY27547.1 hypothetical protein CHL78_008760 [Romboutsia weinsteinii]